MPLVDSPSAESYLEDPQAASRALQTTAIRLAIIVLAGLAGLLAIGVLTDVLLPGFGSVSGSVRDLDGYPLQVEVGIEGLQVPTHSDSNGLFRIIGVPAGHHTLVLNLANGPATFEVEIPKGGDFSIGQIQIDPDF